MATVLIIDDDYQLGAALGAFFERRGHHVVRVTTGEAGIEAFVRARPELVLLDLRLPDIPGFDVLARIREYDPVVIMITGHGDVELAVQAMQEGAENFLAKPIDLAHLAVAAERALEKARLRQMHRFMRDRHGHARMSSLLGSSPAMRELAHQIDMLAGSERTTVLLQGESGTGKGRIAQAIHASSPRAAKPFIEIACAGRAPGMLMAELFGDGDGGQTRSLALIEVAEGGTLFFDEVAALDMELQGRLLGLLEGRGYRRAGQSVEITADVRVIAATGRDLVDGVNEGRFREDLYYRLSVMPVHLPPLRARAREDVLELVARLLDDLRTEVADAPAELSDGALEQLLRYPWPGNVRELRNALERAMIVGHGERRIAVEHLPLDVRRASGAGVARHVPRSLAEVERMHIERTLLAHHENRTHAARELGISRATLINRIKAYGLRSRSASPTSPGTRPPNPNA